MNIIKKKLYEHAAVKWNISLYFYESFLGEVPINIHRKMIAVPRYIRHAKYLTEIQLFYKVILSNVLSFALILGRQEAFLW